MTNYSYDETGVYFSYFVVSILALILAPATYHWLLNSSGSFGKNSSCNCSKCKAKFEAVRAKQARSQRGQRMFKLLLLVAGWAVVGYLVHVIRTTEVATPEIWNPWEVLDVPESATKAEVRRKYRALSLQWHPDKATEENKEEANRKFIEIAKAYKVLTNDDAREEYDKYGHPDGKQEFSMGIALPLWLVDAHNSPIVLLAYGLLFGVFLPYRIGKWWYGTRQYTKDKILTKTMGILFKRVHEEAGIKQILSVIASSREFEEEIKYRRVDDKYTKDTEAGLTKAFKEVGDEWQVPEMVAKDKAARKALVNLVAHFLRVPPGGSKDSPASKDMQAVDDRERTVVRSLHLLQRGLLQITLARGWLVPSLFVMDISQMLVQGTWHSMSPLLQVPHITEDHLATLRGLETPIRSLQDLGEMADTQRRTALKDLSEAQYADVSAFLHAFPRIVLEKVNFRVAGEEHITPGALVTCTLRVRLAPMTITLAQLNAEYEAKKEAKARAKAAAKEADGASGDKSDANDEEDDDEEEEVDALGLQGEGDGGATRARLLKQSKLAHCPRFMADKRPAWWVFIGNVHSNRVINAMRVPDLDLHGCKTINVQFQAPNQTGQFPFSVFIKSDHYVGCDMRLDVQMAVVDPPAQPQVADDDDDISDPDEDTLAGQMAVLRGQRTRQTNPEDDDDVTSSSDDDSSSSEEEE